MAPKFWKIYEAMCNIYIFIVIYFFELSEHVISFVLPYLRINLGLWKNKIKK